MNARSVIYICLANLLGGSSYVVTSLALRGFTSVELVFWRILAAALLLSLLLFSRLRKLKLSAEDWLRTAAVGVLGYAAPLLIGTRGQELSSSTKAALLIGIEPVSIVLLSALFLGERLSGRRIACILCGLIGGVLIVLQGSAPMARTLTPDLLGDLLLFLHGFGWALYTIIGKPVLRRVDPLTFTGLTTLFALAPTAPLAWSSLSRPRHCPPESIAALAYLTVAVTILACWCWNKAMEEIPASSLANFIFLQPLVGVLLGVGVQGEALTRWSAAGGVMILAGAYGSTLIPLAAESSTRPAKASPNESGAPSRV